jgi:hypothetical protein
MLAPLFGVGQKRLANVRRALKKAGLIAVTFGAQLVAHSGEEYERQMLVWQIEGKPRAPVHRVTMRELAALGIQNPANTLFIEVNDPLPIFPFCEKFTLTCRPGFKKGK